jgi:carboxyl-terminal processing protease
LVRFSSKPIDLTYNTNKSNDFRATHTIWALHQALDYANKDKNGIATRTQEKNYNAYKTKKPNCL